MKKTYSHIYINSDNEQINIEFEVIDNLEVLSFRKGIDPNNIIDQDNLNFYFDFQYKLSENEYIVTPTNKLPKSVKGITLRKSDLRLFKRNDKIYHNIDYSLLVYMLDDDFVKIEKTIKNYSGKIEINLYPLIFVTFNSTHEQEEALEALNLLNNALAEVNFASNSFSYTSPMESQLFEYEDPPLKDINNKLYGAIEAIHKNGLKCNSDIRIGIIDDGIYPHRCLKAAIDDNYKYDYLYRSSHQVFDTNDWHGTMCAGVIGSRISKGYGMLGVASGCSLIPLKIKKNEETSIFYFLHAVHDAVFRKGINISVVNCSLDVAFEESEIMKQYLTYAIPEGRGGLGLPFVMSAGNKESEISFLHKLPVVITVAAADFNNSPIKYSNYGKEVLVSAYGEKIIAPDKPGTDVSGIGKFFEDYYDYEYFCGTSAAAPQVAGGIGLLLSKNPKLELKDIIDTIKLSVNPKFKNSDLNNYGSGVFNLNQLNI